MGHAVTLMDRSTSPVMRERVLSLVYALVIPKSAATEARAAAAARANGAAFIEAGGMRLLADLLAGASLC